ncbi:MAG: flagellar hook-length control protein FliK [Candidatus Gastranaerophilales bacterium]|nr:flagellar hook-length control protein FliK [Candidatus Gastranaerophilales bacterium]
MTNLTFNDIKDVNSNKEKLFSVKQDYSSIDKDNFLKVFENANKANNFNFNNFEETVTKESQSSNKMTFDSENSFTKNYLTAPVSESNCKNRSFEKENTDKLSNNIQNKNNYINPNKQEDLSENKAKLQEKISTYNAIQDKAVIHDSQTKVNQHSDFKSKKQVVVQKEEKTEDNIEETINQKSKDKKVSEQTNKEIKTNIDKDILETRIQLATTVDINITGNKNNESTNKAENKLSQNNSKESLSVKVNVNQSHEKIKITQQTDQNSKLKIKIDNFQHPETSTLSKAETKLSNNAVKPVKEDNTIDKLSNNAVKPVKEDNTIDKLSNNAVKPVKEDNTIDKLSNNAVKPVKEDNTIDKLSNNAVKSVKEKNTDDKKVETTPQLQENTKLNNKSADIDISKNQKKIEVLLQNDHTEATVSVMKQEQPRVSSLDQKDLGDILNKNGLTKPEVTKLDVRNDANDTSSGQKQKQNLTEEQTTKLTSQLIQAGDTGSSKISTEQVITFNKMLESTQESKVNTNSILDQVNQKISNEIKSGKSEITMSLRPESLGKVDIKIVSEKGVVTAQITTENSQVKEILNKEIDVLRQKLQDQGVNLDKIVVKVQEPAQTNNNNQNFDQNSQKFNQGQNASNSSDFNSSKHAQEQTGQKGISYDDNDFNAETDLNTNNDEVTSEIHQGMIDYRI